MNPRAWTSGPSTSIREASAFTVRTHTVFTGVLPPSTEAWVQLPGFDAGKVRDPEATWKLHALHRVACVADRLHDICRRGMTMARTTLRAYALADVLGDATTDVVAAGEALGADAMLDVARAVCGDPIGRADDSLDHMEAEARRAVFILDVLVVKAQRARGSP